MLNSLRRLLFSVPMLSAAGIVVLYLLLGFFALPAALKWQAEKQVREQLGHGLTLTEARFNPLTLELEVRGLSLSDAQGQPLLGLQRLAVDFELMRSVADRAWSFGVVTLEAPDLKFTLDKDGRHNFSALFERLAGSAPQPEAPAALPRLAVKRIALSQGRIEVTDRLLSEPLLTRITPLEFEVDDLSTAGASPARYRLSAPSADGATFSTEGELVVNPFVAKGQLALGKLKVATLVRSLSRWVAIDAPAGQIDAAAQFDLGVDASGQLAGTLSKVELGATALSLSARGGAAPLLALEQVSLSQGRVDLAKQEVAFGRFRLANGQVRATTDAQGRLDWTTLVRASAASPRAEGPAASPAPWRLSIAGTEVAGVAMSLSDANQGRSATIDAVALKGAASADVGAAGVKLRLDQPALSLAGVRLEQRGDSLAAPALQFEAGRLSIATAAGFELALDAPRATAAQGLSVKQAQDAVTLASASLQADSAAMQQAGDNLSGTVAAARLALAGATVTQAGQSATLADLALDGQSVSLQSAPELLTVALQKWRGRLGELQAQRGPERLALRSATLALDEAALNPRTAALSLTGTAVSLAGLAAQRGEERLSLEDGGFEARTITARSGDAPRAAPRPAGAASAVALAPAAGASAPGAGLRARIDDATLRLAALQVAALGASPELARLARLNLSAKSLRMSQPEASLDVEGDGLAAELTDARLRSPQGATELLRLGRATLAGGALRLRERAFSAEAVTLADSSANTWLDDQGRVNLLHLFAPAATTQANASPAPAAATAPWRIAVKQTAVDGLAVGFEDRRESPPLALRLQPIRARVAALDTAAKAPMQVELQATLASGGEIRVEGNVHAGSGAADLNLDVQGIALAPLQNALAQFAKLKLASGSASSQGRLRYGDVAGTGAQLEYRASVAVDKLLLEELAPQRPFLSWDAVATDDLLLTLQPNRLDIGELRITKPSGRLIIAADQSVNVIDVLKKPDGGAAAARPAGEPAQAFPVSVERLKVTEGLLEFADLSLRPQFAARMHELKGVITGLGTDPNSSAKLALDARVDKFGAAKIGGQLSVFKPEQLTEVEMSFRNLEMTTLSPYVVKFAGYRIASGRLDLDLQYKVRDSKLLGENKIVIRKMVLGEKVESPDALDLPLELAVAILKDSKGVIDIGVPVSGNLEDPKFDIGAVVGKAIGNLLGGIVTAPFRALGALFGGGDKPLDTIAFEPGSPELAPPERQKLADLATALKARPALTLVVPPTYSSAQDTPALKSLAVRREIVTAMGIELAEGEDPGPIDAANPRARAAIVAAFSTRYAPEVFAALKGRAIAAALPPPAAAAAASAPAAAASAPPPEAPSAFYQGLLDRMVREQPVEDTTLAQLALQRGQSIVDELVKGGGVPAARSALGPARQAPAADGKSVTLQLELKAAP